MLVLLILMVIYINTPKIRKNYICGILFDNNCGEFDLFARFLNCFASDDENKNIFSILCQKQNRILREIAVIETQPETGLLAQDKGNSLLRVNTQPSNE